MPLLVVLAAPAYAQSPTLEQAYGAYQNEPIDKYPAASTFRRLGRAVGKLEVVTDAGTATCTAFLVAADQAAVTLAPDATIS